jgi:hypothetical protein
MSAVIAEPLSPSVLALPDSTTSRVTPAAVADSDESSTPAPNGIARSVFDPTT